MKATRNTSRSPSLRSNYVAYGLLLGSLFVLFYLMVSTQFSYSQEALLELDRAKVDSSKQAFVKVDSAEKNSCKA